MFARLSTKKPPTRRHFVAIGFGFLGSLIAPIWSYAKRKWPVRTVEKPNPEIDLNTWRLHIDGHVEEKLTLDYEELQKLPLIVQKKDLRCVLYFLIYFLRIFHQALAYPTSIGSSLSSLYFSEFVRAHAQNVIIFFPLLIQSWSL